MAELEWQNAEGQNNKLGKEVTYRFQAFNNTSLKYAYTYIILSDMGMTKKQLLRNPMDYTIGSLEDAFSE